MITLKEAFGAGVLLAFLILFVASMLQLPTADSPREIFRVASRTLRAIFFFIVPTSLIGLLISIGVDTIGEEIALGSMPPGSGVIIAAFAFGYTLSIIGISWFTSPV